MAPISACRLSVTCMMSAIAAWFAPCEPTPCSIRPSKKHSTLGENANVTVPAVIIRHPRQRVLILPSLPCKYVKKGVEATCAAGQPALMSPIVADETWKRVSAYSGKKGWANVVEMPAVGSTIEGQATRAMHR